MKWMKMTALLILIPLALYTSLEASAASKSVSPSQALQELKDGAERFATNKCTYPHQNAARLKEIIGGQNPYAMILSCADSRVPLEMIFDAGFGDLFAVRVAGNVAGPEQIGSMEYGAGHLGAGLLVVLGHTKCGAVTAAASGGEAEGSIVEIVREIQPAVERAKEKKASLSGGELVSAAINENVWTTIESLMRNSSILREKVEDGSLQVVGAVYHLEDSRVEWLGRLPQEKEFLAALPKTESHGESALAEATPGRTRTPAPTHPAVENQQAQVEQLQKELQDLKAQSHPNDSILAGLIEEVRLLKYQLYAISGDPLASGKEIVSTEDGFALPDSSMLDRLSAQITTVRTDVDKVRKEKAQNSPAVKQGTINLTAMLHEHFSTRFGDNKSSSFDTKRVRLGVNGSLNKYAGIEIVGEFAKTPKLVDGDVALYPTKGLTMRFGQFRPPSGTELSRSSAALPFVNYALQMGLNTDRDLGAAAYYQVKTSKWFDATFMAGLFNGAGANTSDSNTTKNQAYRAEFKFGENFMFAPNGYTGKTNNVDGKPIDTYGATLNWHNKTQVVETEFTHSKVAGKEKQGWYLWGGQTVATGLKFCPELQLVGRYEQYDSDKNVADNAVDRVTVGANFFIDKRFTMLQMNYQFNGEQGNSISNDEFLMNIQVTF